MTSYTCIPATAADPCPNPPATGQWLRLPDGSLVPADEATAAAAGLLPAQPPAEAPDTSHQET